MPRSKANVAEDAVCPWCKNSEHLIFIEKIPRFNDRIFNVVLPAYSKMTCSVCRASKDFPATLSKADLTRAWNAWQD